MKTTGNFIELHVPCPLMEFCCELLKITLFTGTAFMGAAMLPKNVRYGVPFGTGNWWPKMCVQGS